MGEAKRKAASGESARPKLRTVVAFTGDSKIADHLAVSNPLSVVLDVDAAADGLRKAGYQVFRLPEDDDRRFAISPFTDYLEARIDGRYEPPIVSAIFNEIDGIVGKHGGVTAACGPADGHKPFAGLEQAQEGLFRRRAARRPEPKEDN